ncbi:MAG: hypothetical protein NZ519_09515 [Bacteroidia bacterium]|nr:hypothetical protein [Bacteroidia bacterium]MDW8301879.1 hypothetical protein [Bacteroidia bacterium]
MQTSFVPKEYYNSTVEKHVKQYPLYQTTKNKLYRKIVNNQVKVFTADAINWERELYYLLQYNALDSRQAEYFDFSIEQESNRIKVIATRKKNCAYKTPLASQSLLWDKTTQKPIFIRSHIVRKTWFYWQDIESKATFEIQNGQFFVKRTFNHFFTQVAFFKPKEVVIYGNFVSE